ncbi:MAG: hypothetical protein R3362_05155, partial [Rhodothermales bacterium]|nr:hypothetical protein [Rhodothermales bacterium]
MPRLLRLPLRLVQAAALLVAAAAFLLVVLTRTQVGRDEVARQVEQAFGERFRGDVEIGRLEGNLLWDLYATDVRLRDPAGRAVLAADSVVLEPAWRSLIEQRLTIRRVTLFRPRLTLARSASGRWNVVEAFERLVPDSTAGGDPLAFDLASVRIVDGTLVTENAGAVPAAVASGVLFDYTNARATDLDAQLRLAWGDAERTVRVERLSADLPALFRIRRLDGTLRLSEGGLHFEGVRLRTDSTHLLGTLRLARGEPGPRTLDALLRPSVLSGAELARVLPALPLAAPVEAQGQLSGPLDALDVEWLALRHGASQVEFAGRITGLPRRAGFDLRS